MKKNKTTTRKLIKGFIKMSNNIITLKHNDIILFQGDSITDGNRGKQNSDPNHIHGHGYQYILAAEISAQNIGRDFTFYNRGISGNRISDLYGRWAEDCINIKPTILSMLIGINDIHFIYENNSGSCPDRFEKIYRQCLEEVKEQGPDTLFVLMEPFYGVNPNPELTEFFKNRIGFYQEKVQKIAEDFDAAFVPLQNMINENAQLTDIYNILWDGIHPTTMGHHLIAQQWKKYASDRINTR